MLSVKYLVLIGVHEHNSTILFRIRALPFGNMNRLLMSMCSMVLYSVNMDVILAHDIDKALA